MCNFNFSSTIQCFITVLLKSAAALNTDLRNTDLKKAFLFEYFEVIDKKTTIRLRETLIQIIKNFTFLLVQTFQS
jgi:hypothetical protein